MKDKDEAIFWAVLRDSGSLSSEEEACLHDWLEADPGRRGTLLRAEATLSYLDRARALNHPGIELDEDPVPLAGFNRRYVLAGSLFSVSLALGIGAFSLRKRNEERYATALGEIRRIPLSDGSLATINTSSQVAVEMEPDRRLITLEEGEAWFQVAHDAKRPFIVQVGQVRVRALGTAFSVRQRNGRADVLVTEGVVQAWNDREEGKGAKLAAGFRASLSQTSPAIEVKEASAEIERALAWRNGEISLSGETLGEAVSEFNRYNVRKLIVTDASLARAPLVGYFQASEPKNFALAVASIVQAKVIETNDAIFIEKNSPS